MATPRLLRNGSATFRGILGARTGVLRAAHSIKLYSNISTTCRKCFVGQSTSGRGTVYFHQTATRRQLSSGNSLANKEQNEGELFTPTPTFDSVTAEYSSSGQSVDAVSGVTDGLLAQTENFAALGLGGYTPPGLLQSLLEFLHVNVHLPWWVAIATATVALRLSLFPLAVRMQRDAAKIANLNPTAAKIHETMAAYKRIGNQLAAAEEGAKLLAIYKKHGVNPAATMLMIPMIQVPLFVSFFWAIRGMAELPLESMKTGGIYWFTDLTVPDPTYVLPLMACLTFISNIEVIKFVQQLFNCVVHDGKFLRGLHFVDSCLRFYHSAFVVV